jgi:hypothetical protein
MLTVRAIMRIYLHVRPTDMRGELRLPVCACAERVQGRPLDGSLFLV